MKGKILIGAGILGLIVAGGVAAHDKGKFRVVTTLRSFEEVPSLSSPASGFFKATVDVENETITYELSYEGIAGAPLFAHIHFGQKGVNAGVAVFLCGGGGLPACPVSPATVTGTLTAANVVGPDGQGIAPGEFAELATAIRKGFTYANVHSAARPGGEIRGQIDDIR